MRYQHLWFQFKVRHQLLGPPAAFVYFVAPMQPPDRRSPPACQFRTEEIDKDEQPKDARRSVT
jgi:hypothetical protein